MNQYNVPKYNKPALIQLSLILPTSFSYVIFIEVCHLPSERDNTFALIKLFFNTLFHPDKTIYIWGTIEELIDCIKLHVWLDKRFSCSQFDIRLDP